MREPVTAIFDIGKTNKKLLLFSEEMKVIFEKEERFALQQDEDGFECDDIDHIEKWIHNSLSNIIKSSPYELKAVNFSTYGATLAFIDEDGKRIGPIYNYLKPIDEKIPENLYKRYGGVDEFCRRTASPALGMLNSGIQALWLRQVRPGLFSKVKHILHFPQYVSYILTGKAYSEHTSIGCHTALWDFDNMKYHSWVKDYGLKLPEPSAIDTFEELMFEDKKIKVGIGIHDSSASLAPYFSIGKGKFLLVSTGTWCINMNPFNEEKLTSEQLEKDCLCYMSIAWQPVKSSRLFLGHLHETGIGIINRHFRKPGDHYKNIKTDSKIIDALKLKIGKGRIFLKTGQYSRELSGEVDMYVFNSYEEAYHQLMVELSSLTAESIRLVLSKNDDIKNLYVTGGFSRNDLFLNMLCQAFPDKAVFTSEISNSSALGAALVISEAKHELNLGLKEFKI